MATPLPFRHVARRLWRSPLFTLVSLLTLGVGIGANTAMFSVVYGVLLRPLSFVEADRLVGVWHTAPGLGWDKVNQSPATYLTYREEGRVFEDIGLWNRASVSVTGREEPERVEALVVTDGMLPVLGIQPLFGRAFTREDDTPGAQETVILSHGYWQRKFGAAPDLLGQTLIVEGRPREIIGILPDSFRFLNVNAAVLLPFRLNRAEVFVGNFSFQGVARLKPGATIEQANADIERMLPMVMERFPLPPGFTREMFEETRLGPRVRPLSEDVIGDVGRVLWVLLGTVGIVLLIACANVANLFLVRTEGRQQELAIRAALGASRGRVAGELVKESLVLAVLAGALGMGLAAAGIRLLMAIAPEGLPRLHEIAIDRVVLLFTLVISLLAGLLFGLLPAARLRATRLAASLKEGGRGASDGRERHRLRNALVVSEIALALILLVAAGLMIRSFQAMRQVDPGFTNPGEVLTFRVSIPEALVSDLEQTIRTHEQIVRKIEQIPGVTSVGLTSSITLDGSHSSDPIFVEDFPTAPEGMPPIRRFKWVSENLFETLGRRLVAGRTLTWEDAYTTRRVVVVSENFAREYWVQPENAIGRRIRNAPNDPWREIVGVVADERDDGVAAAAPAVIYWPLLLKDFWSEPLVARRALAYAVRSSRLASPNFIREVQQAVWSVNSGLPLANVRTLRDLAAQSMAQTSFAMVMLAIAAAVALFLGVVGIYGVIAYLAAQRTREIGIRMALGAQLGDVSRLFLRHGALLLGAGLLLGLAGAAALTRLMQSLLFGVSPLDLPTYAAVSVLLGGVALLASYLPARRAARVDPAIALRTEA
jgi:predicted permease